MKKYFLILTIAVLTLAVGHSQTNVSGGIYSDSTWTLAGSPYIVTDTVVVFSNVTLTIEPGVVVKFDDNIRLEIRQAIIIAEGTASDSITFTSNSMAPFPGIWDAVFLNGVDFISNFHYCNFLYADKGIYSYIGFNGTIIIKHSNFIFNKTGINNNNSGFALIDSSNFRYNTDYGLRVKRSTLNYCYISNNAYGLYGQTNIIKNTRVDSSSEVGILSASGATIGSIIENCEIVSNQTGIISAGGEGLTRGRIVNNRIDSNNIAGIVLYGYFNGGDSVLNNQITNNGIGILDTICNGCYGGPDIISKNVIEYNNIGIKEENWIDIISCNKICNNTAYDFYYNADFTNNLSIPFNYWCTPDSAIIRANIYDGYVNINKGLIYFMPIDTTGCYSTSIGLSESKTNQLTIKIYPNPTTGIFTVQGTVTDIQVYDLFGRKVLVSNKPEIDMSSYPAGLYIWQIGSERGKLVLE